MEKLLSDWALHQSGSGKEDKKDKKDKKEQEGELEKKVTEEAGAKVINTWVIHHP